jgi:hypothetical protein
MSHPEDSTIRTRQNMAVQTNPTFSYWMSKKREAIGYLSSVRPVFNQRDENVRKSFDQRHGLEKANIPPSHRDVVPDGTSRQPNEILARLVAVLTAVYPTWIFKADSMSSAAGLRASAMSLFARSLFMGVERRAVTPIVSVAMDEALSKGGAMLKVHFRLDRWQGLPHKDAGESDKDYHDRVYDYKARNIPFDIIVPSYETLYYDNTVDGLVRVVEEYRTSVYDIASTFGGKYNESSGVLSIPTRLDTGELDEEGQPMYLDTDININCGRSRDVDYMEYWSKGECALFMVNDTPVAYHELEKDLPLPYFLILGETTSSKDPGRMGLPVLYNAEYEFTRKNNLRAMEDAFLYKHGFARLVRTRKAENIPAIEEPDNPDRDEEEEVIGEVLDLEVGENALYIAPANVSALFTDAKADVERAIDQVALADVLSGRLPPAGTTGYLMSQLFVAATSKYVPILTHMSWGLADATNYMIDLADRYLVSELVVNMASDERTNATYSIYKPGFSKGNRNLEVRIEAPLPSDMIPKSEWLMKGHEAGFVSRERVQREGFQIEDSAAEDEKMLIEKFEKFYEPIAMLRAQKRAGQMDLVLEAVQAGLMPPEIEALVMAFATGPDGAQPANQMGPGAIAGNPNGVLAPQPGLGQSAVPTTGATANAKPTMGEAQPAGPAAPARSA